MRVAFNNLSPCNCVPTPFPRAPASNVSVGELREFAVLERQNPDQSRNVHASLTSPFRSRPLAVTSNLHENRHRRMLYCGVDQMFHVSSAHIAVIKGQCRVRNMTWPCPRLTDVNHLTRECDVLNDCIALTTRRSWFMNPWSDLQGLDGSNPSRRLVIMPLISPRTPRVEIVAIQ